MSSYELRATPARENRQEVKVKKTQPRQHTRATSSKSATRKKTTTSKSTPFAISKTFEKSDKSVSTMPTEGSTGADSGASNSPDDSMGQLQARFVALEERFAA